MREAFSIDLHAGHAWLHFFVRLIVVLLLVLLFAWLTEASGKTQSPQRQLTRAEILTAEQRLSDLGYWTGPVDGVLDNATQHALIAFQKIEGRKRTGRFTPAELEALLSACPPEPRDKSYSHIEVDLKRQVLVVVDNQGKPTNMLPVCTGNEQVYTESGRVQRAHTPRGTFTVTRKIAGWRLSRLGLLYYPNYIFNGIAIHGSPFIRTYPDSHGCIRIPMFAAKEIAALTPVGTVVVVYDD
jgi:lipoprotein-anchoring transpeptidase ErfK/SrfK